MYLTFSVFAVTNSSFSKPLRIASIDDSCEIDELLSFSMSDAMAQIRCIVTSLRFAWLFAWFDVGLAGYLWVSLVGSDLVMSFTFVRNMIL